MLSISQRARLALLPALALAMACGGGGDTPPAGATGVFLDSEVQGLRYVGPNHSGFTNAAGEYDYEPGDLVCFFLDQLELGCTEGAGVVTPVDLFPDADPGDDQVVNVVRLFLALDSDGDPSNGIDVSGVSIDDTAASGIDFDQSTGDFGSDTDVTSLVTTQGHDGTLPSEEDAADHIEDTLDDNDVFANRLVGSWTYIRWLEGFPALELVRTLTISSVESVQATSDASSVTFVLTEEESEGEVQVPNALTCTHLGLEVESLEVFGYVTCEVDGGELEEPAGFPGGAPFLMEKISAITSYARSDLIGPWLYSDSQMQGDFGIGNFVNFTDASYLDLIDAQMSASGAVTFTTTDGFPGEQQSAALVEVPPDVCSYTGQMDAEKLLFAGNATCTVTGEKAFVMEAAFF